MALSFVLDANVVLYLLAERLATLLPEGEHYDSVITELELLSYPALEADEERRIRAFFGGVGLVGLTPTVRETTIRLRRAQRLKLPDAIIAATAVSLGAELVTNDLRLARVPGLQCRPVQLKP